MQPCHKLLDAHDDVLPRSDRGEHFHLKLRRPFAQPFLRPRAAARSSVQVRLDRFAPRWRSRVWDLRVSVLFVFPRNVAPASLRPEPRPPPRGCAVRVGRGDGKAHGPVRSRRFRGRTRVKCSIVNFLAVTDHRVLCLERLAANVAGEGLGRPELPSERQVVVSQEIAPGRTVPSLVPHAFVGFACALAPGRRGLPNKLRRPTASIVFYRLATGDRGRPLRSLQFRTRALPLLPWLPWPPSFLRITGTTPVSRTVVRSQRPPTRFISIHDFVRRTL